MITTLKSGLKVFRDDLFPFLGGGNKGRKIEYISKDIVKQGANAIVTTGGIQSNHCRAAAVMAAQNGWKCTLVIHGDEKSFFNQGGNAMLMRSTDSTLIFVKPDEIERTMDLAMKTYEEDGFRPYYIYGGGHTLDGGLSYVDAIADLKRYLKATDTSITYIFLASGTGSTQAGILAGLDKYSLDSEVIGVSVGRPKARAEQVVQEFYSELCDNYNIHGGRRRVTVLDEYLCGGYGNYNAEIKELSLNSIKKYGFALDTTYTAKAFYGMHKYINKHKLTGNILFWHTGGLLNFLAEN